MHLLWAQLSEKCSGYLWDVCSDRPVIDTIGQCAIHDERDRRKTVRQGERRFSDPKGFPPHRLHSRVGPF